MTEYQTLIANFLESGYKTDFFNTSVNQSRVLIIRHDIDFDIDYAHQLSLQEDELGIQSSYFFLLHSKAYNLFEKSNLDKVKSIISRGHKASIHFDPTLYEDIEAGFAAEKQLFETILKVKIEFISIHRPSDYFINNPNTICGVEHTYSPVFFEKIKYFADSQGQFRYGHPLDSAEFKNKKSIQLLIHPIWWVTKGGKTIGST